MISSPYDYERGHSRRDCDEDGYPDPEPGFECAHCGERHDEIYRYKTLKRPRKGGPVSRRVTIQPRVWQGQEYGHSCLLDALAQHRREKRAQARKPATTATVTVVLAQAVA